MVDQKKHAKLIPLSAWTAARHDPPKPITTLRRWCREGRLPGAKREGREWRVPADSEYVGKGHSAVPPDLMEFIFGRQRK
jgi:hypothetical protein